MLERLESLLVLRHLPPRVAWFYWRARRLAARSDDEFSLPSAARPPELGRLLRLARGRANVVELGTGTAWTAIALALADRGRTVTTYDPVTRPERERYLQLVPDDVRARIEFVEAGGEAGPPRPEVSAAFLFLDSSHERQETIDSFRSWEPALASGAIVAFHDYGTAAYPGVAEAVAELGLEGDVVPPLFVWRKP